MSYTRTSSKINFLYDYSQLYELISTLITRKLRTIDGKFVDDYGLTDVDKAIYNSLAENTAKTILLLMMKMTYGIDEDIVLVFPDETNLLSNASFEVFDGTADDGITDDFEDWIESGATATKVIQAVTPTAYVANGDIAVKISTDVFISPTLKQVIDLEKGVNYKLSYYTRNNALLIIYPDQLTVNTNAFGNTLTKKEVEFKYTSDNVYPYIQLSTNPGAGSKEATFDYMILYADSLIFRINDKEGFNDNLLFPVDNSIKEYLKHDILRQWFQIYNLTELVKAEMIYIRKLELSLFKNFIELRKPLIT